MSSEQYKVKVIKKEISGKEEKRVKAPAGFIC